MLKYFGRNQIAVRLSKKRSFSAEAASSRQFTYFDNFEVKDGVGIVRFNGPNKMNTISIGMTR